MNILLRRWGALGDVLCVTPIAHELRTMYPDAIIDIETFHYNVFEKNPHINEAYPPGAFSRAYDQVIDLNDAYEKRPNRHIVEAYYDEAGLLWGSPESTPFDFSGKKRVVYGLDPVPPLALRLQTKVVSIHAATTWSSRTLPPAFWDTVIGNLVHNGFSVVMLGAGNDYHGPAEAADAVGKLSLRDSVNQIAASVCFIGNDSSMLHFAGATETPIVGIYTSVKAEYRMPYRHGRLGWAVATIEAHVPCYGCLADAPAPANNLTCKFGTDACVEDVLLNRADDVVLEVLKMQAAQEAAIALPGQAHSSPADPPSGAMPSTLRNPDPGPQIPVGT